MDDQGYPHDLGHLQIVIFIGKLIIAKCQSGFRVPYFQTNQNRDGAMRLLGPKRGDPPALQENVPLTKVNTYIEKYIYIASIYIYIYVCMFACIYVRTYVSTYVRIYICMYIYVCM